MDAAFPHYSIILVGTKFFGCGLCPKCRILATPLHTNTQNSRIRSVHNCVHAINYLFSDDGRVGLKSIHGRFLNGTDDKMDCYMLDMKPEALWTIHLAIHPQINLRNVNRRTYAHYVEDANGKSIKVC